MHGSRVRACLPLSARACASVHVHVDRRGSGRLWKVVGVEDRGRSWSGRSWTAVGEEGRGRSESGEGGGAAWHGADQRETDQREITRDQRETDQREITRDHARSARDGARTSLLHSSVG